MDPSVQFCPNSACRDKGLRGRGTIGVHSRKERRYRCHTCGKTFAATTGTPFYRLHHAAEVLSVVVTLLSLGCPLQAIVVAFGLDERTVRAWWLRSGQHSAQVHTHLVQAGHVDLGHVQADELWVKVRQGRVWQAMAMAVPSRLWLGGVVSAQRDEALIMTLMQGVRSCACRLAVLVCVDGLASYVTAVRRVFRVRVLSGTPGRPRLVLPDTVLLAQVLKHARKRRVVEVTHRIVLGTAQAVATVLAATHSGRQINTAYIERLNATFRACLVPLTRRGRRLVRDVALLQAGMFLVGTTYNFCWVHRSLRRPIGAGRQWQERTPAMAAGLTDHIWTVQELLRYQVPPAPYVTPKRRGRPPKAKPEVLSRPRRRGRPSTPRPAEAAA
jgi:transposase-like protein